jgi:ribose 5-phosphate isomerase B
VIRSYGNRLTRLAHFASANRYPGVRAALAWEPEIGALSRRHNDSNILVLPARFMSDEEGIETMKAWLNAKFEGGRHERRIEKIDQPDAPGGTA